MSILTSIKDFFKNAFSDMAESAKAQHEVDKAQFAAAKAEARANFEQARAMGRPETRKKLEQQAREEKISEAYGRIREAEEKIANTRK